MKKQLIYSLCVGAIALSLAACSGQSSSTATTKNEYAPVNKNTLVRANGSEPDSLDPAKLQTNVSSNIALDLYEGLVSEDQANNPVPGVAKSWKVSNDGKTYTFYLRHNTKWSNGDPVTAEDFVYAFRRNVTPKTASPMAYKLAPIVNANAIMAGKMSVDKLGIKAIGKWEIKINLEHPVYFFPSVMADAISFPQYAKGIQKFGESFFQPGKLISNGAYKLQSWIPNGHVTVTKNAYYWDANNVHIKNVKFLPIVSRIPALNNYQSGSVDYVLYVPTSNLKQLKQDYGSQLKETPWLDMEYLDFNMTRLPFKNNLKLRKALSIAIDRKAIVKYVAKGGQIPLYTFYPTSVDGGIYKDDQYKWRNIPMDKRIAEAKKLYKEAGYSKDNPLKISIEYNTDVVHKRVIEAISEMWKKELGVQTSIGNSEFKVFLKVRQSHNYNGVARDGWVADFNTIDNFASSYMCNNPQNNAGYCNPKYDKLMKEAQQQSTRDAAKPYYTKAIKVALKDYPLIPIYTDQVIHLVKPYVKGYKMETNHLDHVYDKWFSFAYAPKKPS